MIPTGRVLLIAAALTLVAVPGARAQSAEEAAVRAAEDRRIKALIDDDFAALEEVLADDLTYTHSNASVDTKASYIETLRKGTTKYAAIERDTPVVRLYGNTAILTGAATMTMRGQADPVRLRYTLVYVKRDGRWQAVAWQSTRLP
ncbi:MAG TPA: nuclear transport factor 2 family protein [Vicinamibacterales bacterium]